MSIYLSLFLTFLKIGAFSFGGGYGMIAVIRESCLANGWLTEEELLNFIAVAESTPGPIAVNMATFVGSSQGGVFGAALATLGVVLPSFLVILLIAAAMNDLLRHRGIKAGLDGVKPVVVGLIIAAGAGMVLSVLFSFGKPDVDAAPDIRAVIIFVFVAALAGFWKKLGKKSISPILLILLSAAAGIALYGFAG